MLIFQRRVGDRIVMSGGIEITVAAITKSGVKLAVRAPRGVAVLRGEVHDSIAAANAQAARSNGEPLEFEQVVEAEEAK
jgi:carbon storage regulator CsrA